MKKVSKVIRSNKRPPRDKIVDLIEYTIETDEAHHFKMEGENLWSYERYNLDVFAFLMVIIYVVYRLILALVRHGMNGIFPINRKRNTIDKVETFK